MTRPLAGLTTRGRCLLAAGLAAALCALLLNERDLLRIATFAVLLPLLATLVATRAETGLRAERELVPPRTPAGTALAVLLTVRCTGRLGGGALLEDDLPAELGGRPRFVVTRLSRRDAVRVQYPLAPRMRGVHTLGPLVVWISDPFGLAQYRRELGGQSRLVVTPRVVALTGTPSGDGRAGGAEGAGRLRSGTGTDAVVVRAYQQGDDLRKVHWRSTARRDELMVRVEERPWHGGSSVLLDHRGSAHRGSGPDSSLEYAVSLAASVCLQLRAHGRQVQVLTGDGRPLGGEAETMAGAGSDALLDALAALRPSAQRAMRYTAALEAATELIAVLGAVSAADVEQLLRHRPRGLRSHAVLLDVAAWAGPGGDGRGGRPDPAEAADLLRAAGWSVVVAGPGEAIAAVWNRLCGRSRDKQVTR